MAKGRTLLAAASLAFLASCVPTIAAEFIVEIGGTAGTPFGGTCLLIRSNTNTNYEAAGTVPLTLEFSGDIISCAIQRRSGSGLLRIVIKSTDGRTVAESSDVQPFGIVMAAGR